MIALHHLEVLAITIIRLPNGGKDKVAFKIKGTAQFPEVYPDEPAEVMCETRAGYAEEWLEKLGIDRELVPIEVKDFRRKHWTKFSESERP
jgi:hypothetical protein